MKNLALLILIVVFALSANAQKRDSLTETEADLVRDTQEIDKRIEVFIKTIDRRFLLIQNPNATQSNKELEKFGEFPKGTKAQFLSDIDKLIEETITNIDNVAERDQASLLFPKAMKTFSEACKRFIPLLENHQKSAIEEKEKITLESAIENCQQVILAMQKVKMPEPEKKKGKN